MMKIVCFGDSLTSCGGDNGRYSDILQARFPDQTVINAGVGGESFVEAMARLESDVLALRPDIVLLEFGANDWWRNERPCTAWAADLEECIVRIQQSGGRAVVLGVFGPYLDADARVEKVYGTDERALAYRELEAAVAARHGCPYVGNIQERIIGDRRCWSDANHPNEYGNRYVADTIEPILATLLAQPAWPVRKPTLETTRDFWREAVALAAEQLAVVDGERRLSYREADALVERLAAGLYAVTGVARPRVAVYLPNCLEYYLLYWAVQRLGGVIVPLNTWLKEESLQGIFATVQPEVLVVRGPQDALPLAAAGLAVPAAEAPSAEAETPCGLRAAIDEAGVAPLAAVAPIRIVALTPMPGAVPYSELLSTITTAPDTPLAADDLSIIMHTSGTTAAPKGAMMRHSDLMFNVAAAINAHEMSPTDIHLLVNPMFHCTALYSSLPTAAYQKTPVIITAGAEPEELLALVQRERITTFLSVPAVFQRILQFPELDRYDWSSLRVMAYAGSPMPVPTIHALRQRFPTVALHNFFGLTETISMTHVLRNEDVETRADSIGRLLPFVEAIVVDEQDRIVPPGTPGELLFAREEVIPGYYKQPERLRDAIAEIEGRRWFRTGDLAAVDEEGFFSIKGRKKDMIIVGGENVFAAEVEAVLLAHPKVREAAVKGVPATGVRAHLGELVKAYIVPADPSLTEREIKQHCFARLPSYKVPQLLTFLDILPRNPAGKVVKDALG